MTFILGAKCQDGVVMVGDLRITSDDGSYRGLGEKIFSNIPGVVWGAAGSRDYFESFKERVRVAISDVGGEIPASHFLPLVEDIHGHLIQTFGVYFIRNFQILIATRPHANAELYSVGGTGGHSVITGYATIGSGSPYAELFMKKLWNDRLGMKQTAELGYFVVKLIERLRLDETVGVENRHPQVWFLPNNPQAPGSAFGTNADIRSATRLELDQMAETATRKLDLFDRGFEDFLNRS